jgi:class 3 adenylate cyclase/tetratricopeptide (TPR) repeat protein
MATLPPPEGSEVPNGHPSSGHTHRGERRQVTVLFADLVGFTAFSERAGEEAAYGLMQKITEILRTAIEKQGGTVGSFTGDGVMALFGVPQALEDAPLRACRAALAIQERNAEDGLSVEQRYGLQPSLRIGINTGLAVVGHIERTQDSNPTALGDAVNLASRLQALCEPGSVLISEATQRLVEGMVLSRFDGERQIRGKTDPQRVYRLESIHPEAGRFEAAQRRGLTSFVGRKFELEALILSLAETDRGVRVHDIVGEPGIGKSRLLFEFRNSITQSGTFVLVGNCSPDGQQTPFLPFIEVVRGSFRIALGDTESVVAGKLSDGLDILGLSSPQNLGLLLGLLGFRPPMDALRGLDGSLIGLRTRDLLFLLLSARCHQSPVLMIVEDLHWIDSASEELFGRIVAASGTLPLMIVHTRRPGYSPPWIGQSVVHHMAIDPLSAGETAQIIRARLGAHHVPDALERIVTERSEGNALFAEEMTTFLVENAVLQGEAGELWFDPAKLAGALPVSVQSLLSARIDLLSSVDRALLQAASVIGRQFAPDLLAAVVSGDMPIETRLSAMEALDLVHRDFRSSQYVFKHALVRDALYDSLLSASRATLHEQIATEIERRADNRLGEVAELLAHHYSNTDRVEKAFTYLSMAGRKSLDVYSIEEADRFFRRALALTEGRQAAAGSQSIANAIVGLLEATFMKCDMPETRRVAELYLPQLEAMGDSPQLAFALYFLGSAIQNNYEFKEAHRRAKQALEVAERISDIRATAYARMLCFNCCTVMGQLPLDMSEEMGLRVLRESHLASDNYVLNWAYFCIAWDYGVRGLMKDAQTWAQKLKEAGQERGDGRAVGFAHLTMAWLAILDGRYNEGLEHAEMCLKVAVTQFDRVYGDAAKATATIFTGRLDAGLRELLELRRLAIESGLHYAAAGMHGPAGVGLVLTGRMAEGIRLIKSSIENADATGDCGVGFWNRIFLAEIIIELLKSEQTPPLIVIIKNITTIVSAKLFGREQARNLLEEALKFNQLHETGVIRARINMDIGILYKLNGQHNLARQFLMKGRLPAEQQGASFVVNKIDAELAELGRMRRRS